MTISQEWLDELNAVVAPILGRFEAERNGSARQALWPCEDGWVVGYTTERTRGGPHDGRFVVLAYRPVGKGARTGRASEWQRTYTRPFATRKAAKARAIELYRRHSPRWAEAHPQRRREA